MPAVLDGFHWGPDAGGFFVAAGQRLRLIGEPRVIENGKAMVAELPVGPGLLRITFEEHQLMLALDVPLALHFEWDPAKSQLQQVLSDRITYRKDQLDYFVGIGEGTASATDRGCSVEQGSKGIRLILGQPA
jgi:hypothetical protein